MPAQVRPVLKFVRTSGLCVLKQLRLEETLFRASHENWVIANDGTNETAIVMGISGKPHHLLDVAKVHEDTILTIKRFTGGGYRGGGWGHAVRFIDNERQCYSARPVVPGAPDALDECGVQRD
jgi:hypothetical protein